MDQVLAYDMQYVSTYQELLIWILQRSNTAGGSDKLKVKSCSPKYERFLVIEMQNVLVLLLFYRLTIVSG